MNQNTHGKAGGFYVGLAAAILSVISAILYGITFSAIQYKEAVFDKNICLLLIVGGIVGAVMFFIEKTADYAPVVLCAASGIAIMLFIHVIIWPVSDTIYGIEPFAHMNELILCAVLLLLSLITSEVSLYMKKRKPQV